MPEDEAEDNLSRPRPRTKFRPRGQSGLEDLTSLRILHCRRQLVCVFHEFQLQPNNKLFNTVVLDVTNSDTMPMKFIMSIHVRLDLRCSDMRRDEGKVRQCISAYKLGECPS